MKTIRIIGIIMLVAFLGLTYYSAKQASFLPSPESHDWVNFCFVNIFFALGAVFLVMP